MTSENEQDIMEIIGRRCKCEDDDNVTRCEKDESKGLGKKDNNEKQEEQELCTKLSYVLEELFALYNASCYI